MIKTSKAAFLMLPVVFFACCTIWFVWRTVAQRDSAFLIVAVLSAISAFGLRRRYAWAAVLALAVVVSAARIALFGNGYKALWELVAYATFVVIPILANWREFHWKR